MGGLQFFCTSVEQPEARHGRGWGSLNRSAGHDPKLRLLPWGFRAKSEDWEFGSRSALHQQP